MDITIYNYRAFDESHPAHWCLEGPFTAFVGVNNAGKSSLLRFFHEVRPCLGILSNLSDGTAQQAMRGVPIGLRIDSVGDQAEIFCNRNERDMRARFALPPSDGEAEPDAVILRWHRPHARVTVEFEYNRVRGSAQSFGEDSIGFPAAVGEIRLNITRYRDALERLQRAIYLGPFRNAVNLGGSDAYYDLHIGQAFIKQWAQFKTGPNKQQNRMALAVEAELQQIFGLSGLQINAAPGDAALKVVADGQPYQLQEQGAGLAQFIVVLAFIATQRPPYVFIDEPELNLHPSLQLDFLTTLAKYSEIGVAFATHSMGLARAVAQRIYSVRKRPDGARDVRPLEGTRDIVEFLGELSFSGYEELGFKRLLMVEGTTEVPAIQQWLRLYGIEHEVVLVPLGGSSMINGGSGAALSEIRRITSKVSVLIDSERESAEAPLGAERQAFADACTALGFNVCVLERRAVENYLTDDAIKRVKGAKYSALGPYEVLKDQEFAWAKNENWRIAAEMGHDDLGGTDLDRFLEELAAPVPSGT